MFTDAWFIEPCQLSFTLAQLLKRVKLEQKNLGFLKVKIMINFSR